MKLEVYAYKRYASVAKYSGNDRVVVIPQQYKGVPVTEIRDGVFKGADVEAVVLPPTLEIIGERAFADCRKLRYVGYDWNTVSPESAADAPDVSGKSIPNLSVLPPTIRSVGDEAFKGTALRGVQFRSATMELGDSAFEDCRRLLLADFPNCVHHIFGKAVFMNSSIQAFYAPKARFDTMPECFFAHCENLRLVMTLINSVGTRCFYGCSQLRKIYTAKKLRSIGSEALTGCDQLKICSMPNKKASPPPSSPHPPPEDPELKKQRSALLGTLRAIEAKAKEAGSMNSHTIDSVPEPDNSLFRMHIDYRGQPCKVIPSKIKGILGNERGTYHFSIHVPSALAAVGMKTMPDPSLANLAPILNYIAGSGMTVSLLGKQNGSVYSVYEILPASASGRISAPLFHEMVERLRKPVPDNSGPEAAAAPYTMRTEQEFETFLEVCGSRLPPWVLNAYRKNEDTIRRQESMFSDEEKKHARRAQELLLNIDWAPHVVNVPTAEEARSILDGAFFGLDEAKIRAEEIVAQIRRTGSLPKWGILLHGPAGTGKTSIAKAIARLLSLPIIQMDMSSLGEKPDEISGSSRIYGNARPGMLLESMFQIRSSSAVLLANEVDKAGDSKGGRCAADILLTILDKTGFYENFLEEVIPTDNLFAIGTCNDLSRISKPLRDRFLVIDIPAYTPAEKKVIFRDYAFPRAMKQYSISPDQLALDEEAVELLVSEYALEPGARDLERYAERFVGDYCRHADGRDSHVRRVYTAGDVKDLLGPGRAVVRSFAINPGEVNAAFYHDGIAHFYLLEAAVTPGSGKFEVLGPIGKLQEEYCKVAYRCVCNTTNASACDLSKYDVTVFIPQPIPDGPDNHVGLACYAAICSKILNRNLAIRDICFVGGCDLNGSLYFDENNLTPLLRAMKARGVSTLYAPMGTGSLVDPKVNGDCNVTVIEGPSATMLFSLAVARSNHRC